MYILYTQYTDVVSMIQPNDDLRDYHLHADTAVVKVRGLGGLSPLLLFEPPCNSMSPLIEYIKCYFTPK